MKKPLLVVGISSGMLGLLAVNHLVVDSSSNSLGAGLFFLFLCIALAIAAMFLGGNVNKK